MKKRKTGGCHAGILGDGRPHYSWPVLLKLGGRQIDRRTGSDAGNDPPWFSAGGAALLGDGYVRNGGGRRFAAGDCERVVIGAARAFHAAGRADDPRLLERSGRLDGADDQPHQFRKEFRDHRRIARLGGVGAGTLWGSFRPPRRAAGAAHARKPGLARPRDAVITNGQPAAASVLAKSLPLNKSGASSDFASA